MAQLVADFGNHQATSQIQAQGWLGECLVLAQAALYPARTGCGPAQVSAAGRQPMHLDLARQAQRERLRADLCIPMNDHRLDIGNGMGGDIHPPAVNHGQTIASAAQFVAMRKHMQNDAVMVRRE